MSGIPQHSIALHPAALAPRDLGRSGWRVEREALERDVSLRHRTSERGLRARLFNAALDRLGRILAGTALYARGMRNAEAVQLRRIEIVCPDLPGAFDGYRILHLTDLHVDAHPATTEAAADLVAGVDADLCVLTGDYRGATDGPFEQILPALGRLIARVGARDGVYGVLGNHDCAAMAGALESLGVRMLLNESVSLARAGERISMTGLDDVHEFYTDRARDALETSPRGFRIALVHSPELADVAAAEDYRLYLCGHSHGGQICLPGSIPVFTALRRLRRLAAGRWRLGRLCGYTSTGTGVSGLPLRFNTRGEVALITLRAA